MEQSSHCQTIALVRDLMFASKITATARSLGLTVRILRDPAALATTDAAQLLVDLDQAGALEAAAQWRNQSPGRRVIGFVSHVNAGTIDAARQAGLDQVLARSRFTATLDELLKV